MSPPESVEVMHAAPEVMAEETPAPAMVPEMPEVPETPAMPVVPELPSIPEEPEVHEDAAEPEEPVSFAKPNQTDIAEEEDLNMKEDVRPAFMNRELSWLRFNERVLEEAENKEVPLCERLSFASIYQTNLDEFFMVRVGKLIHRNQLDPMDADSRAGMTPKEQIDMIYKETRKMIPRRDKVYAELMEKLEEVGIRIVDYHKIGEDEKKKLRRYFDREIQPLIEPNIVGPKQPFPFLQNQAIYAVAVLETKSGGERIGIIPCGTGVFPRLVQVKEGTNTFILSEELILHYLPEVFRGYTVKAKSLIRVTRNADIDPDEIYKHDGEGDYRDFMSDIIRKRNKLKPVRLELSRELESKIVDVLCTYLKIDRSQVFFYHEPLDLSFVFKLRDLLGQQSELFYKKRVPQKTPQFDMRRPVLDQIVEGDKLLSYPYDSMTPFLELLHQAANDDDVVSIKMTLYRVAKQSKVIEYLLEAAENGKEVTVVVELKARFDELPNIYWSRQLEAAGCRVMYGIPGYKIHSKLLLIMRRVAGQTQYITQIGTGNYNEKTARLYTDMCLMTANPDIGREAQRVFQGLIRQEFIEQSEYLMVAPKTLRKKVLALIDEQIDITKAGGRGYIGLKVNSLADTKVMAKLVEASMAGVQIDIVARGVCCLVPGIPGLTDNIHIISIVGRFLEHTRIFIFGRPSYDPNGEKIYIGSADLMTRNTIHRVEIAAPILDPELKKRVREYFETELKDNMQAREMMNDGTYVRVKKGEAEPMNSQEYFYEMAYREIGEPLPEEVVSLPSEMEFAEDLD